MAPSEDDRLDSSDRPQSSSEVARRGTEPHGTTTPARDRRSVEPRPAPSASAGSPRAVSGAQSRDHEDPGLPAGGSRQETGLHGKPATRGGSNEHARLPDTNHRDL